ncbi:hypothetical protein L21SP5_02204 [Salinivirga cyanobacteriivorans]|uniref:Nitrogen regulatory protein P-II n=1 Tax=Salinivirga cyanobacteriivorans TaxID=1307839 RepID=A0A0S2I0N0_9BACT|nr:PG0541 family transporter-associated protein [Salinivirga cyanobacteriivorans]ALO15837.1 hypothetical protein L21SP5_02204 [Salinivirga cyanobacteriivorans]
MKSVFIVFNQAHTEKVEYMLDYMEIKGFTQWIGVYGRGSQTGVPHMGTHTWPEQNNAILTMVENEKVNKLLENIQKIDAVNKDVGIRAFVWNIEQTV